MMNSGLERGGGGTALGESGKWGGGREGFGQVCDEACMGAAGLGNAAGRISRMASRRYVPGQAARLCSVTRAVGSSREQSGANAGCKCA